MIRVVSFGKTLMLYTLLMPFLGLTLNLYGVVAAGYGVVAAGVDTFKSPYTHCESAFHWHFSHYSGDAFLIQEKV